MINHSNMAICNVIMEFSQDSELVNVDDHDIDTCNVKQYGHFIVIFKVNK